MNFYDWMEYMYDNEDCPGGDLFEDMKCDPDFPVNGDYDEILDYLENLGACDGAIETFEMCWEEYISS